MPCGLVGQVVNEKLYLVIELLGHSPLYPYLLLKSTDVHWCPVLILMSGMVRLNITGGFGSVLEESR